MFFIWNLIGAPEKLQFIAGFACYSEETSTAPPAAGGGQCLAQRLTEIIHFDRAENKDKLSTLASVLNWDELIHADIYPDILLQQKFEQLGESLEKNVLYFS